MVFKILRPDSEKVWKYQEIFQRFARYRGIIDNSEIARYLVAKSVQCDYKADSSTEELEEILADSSIIFNKLLKEPVENLKDRQIFPKNYLTLANVLAEKYLESCIFCERQCEVNRIDDEKGYCSITKDSYVSSVFLHMGEEAPLIPSGTIFFQGCNFGCVFCQNYDISQAWKSKPIENVSKKVSNKELANIAENLVNKGAININYVGGDPIPNIHTIIGSMNFQRSNITQLWNSNFYLTEKSLALIIDLFDFWLPDFKYGNNECGKKYSGV
ncbi:MAG: radical SAM protein, partial [Candidatus Lokiarchaeota archaeon]|nr:radical SAM protein [Candidatus Lokiarchaeota archaeon]